MKNPIQPLYTDEHGTLRFKENEIVRRLLDEGSIDLNQIAQWDVSRNDHEQFAQLIGYSLSGFGTLSYATDDTFETALNMESEGLTELESRCKYLEEKLYDVKSAMKVLIPTLYNIHPDDLDTEYS